MAGSILDQFIFCEFPKINVDSIMENVPRFSSSERHQFNMQGLPINTS
jgi:hypothetical protein